MRSRTNNRRRSGDLDTRTRLELEEDGFAICCRCDSSLSYIELADLIACSSKRLRQTSFLESDTFQESRIKICRAKKVL